MDPQNAIDILGKVIPLAVDILSLIPGVNIPMGAIKIVEDGVSIEQGARNFFVNTAEGRAAWARLSKFAHDDLGLSLGAPAPLVKSESIDEVEADADAGRF